MNNVSELWEAIDDADDATVRSILDQHPEFVETTNRWGFTPLMYAVMCVGRTVSVISAILASGAKINRQTSEGYTALHCAIDVNGEANLNSADVINLLVSAGAD